MKQDLYLIPYTKINSKWIKDLNVRSKLVKLLEENIGANFLMLVLAMDMTPKTQKTEAKINKWDCIKQKSSAK